MKSQIEIIKGITDDWMKSEFNPPASDSQIEEFEKNTDVRIPESYKEFLRYSNGAKLFGGDTYLYGVDFDDEFRINYDLSEDEVPKELLIVGFYNSRHICYDLRYNSFILYEYEDYDDIEEECAKFSDFYELLDYLIDIAKS